MLKNLCLLLLITFTVNVAQAQLEKVLHQTFLLDDIDLVDLNIAGEVAVEEWAGNTIMTETKIRIFAGSRGIINYFVKAGRYDIIQDSLGSAGIRLHSKDNVRRPIKTQTGVCREEITVRVFVPEDFKQNGNGRLERIIEEEPLESPAIEPTAQVVKDSFFLTPVQVDSTFTNASTTDKGE